MHSRKTQSVFPQRTGEIFTNWSTNGHLDGVAEGTRRTAFELKYFCVLVCNRSARLNGQSQQVFVTIWINAFAIICRWVGTTQCRSVGSHRVTICLCRMHRFPIATQPLFQQNAVRLATDSNRNLWQIITWRRNAKQLLGTSGFAGAMFWSKHNKRFTQSTVLSFGGVHGFLRIFVFISHELRLLIWTWTHKPNIPLSRVRMNCKLFIQMLTKPINLILLFLQMKSKYDSNIESWTSFAHFIRMPNRCPNSVLQSLWHWPRHWRQSE